MRIIKPTGNSIAISATQNTIFGSTIVYLASIGVSQVNVYSNSTVLRSTFVIPANQFIFLNKLTTDLITANTEVFATPTSYKG